VLQLRAGQWQHEEYLLPEERRWPVLELQHGQLLHDRPGLLQWHLHGPEQHHQLWPLWHHLHRDEACLV
jgi:hypothetical protein